LMIISIVEKRNVS